jgi:orotidine-5'-phosphate decarboxylase
VFLGNTMHPSPAKSYSKLAISASERLIVALDVQNIGEAREMVKKLEGIVSFYKIGLSLQLAEGTLDFIQELIALGNRVFLDYKYLDIQETIENAVARVASIGVSFLTVHGNGKVIRAAVEGRGKSDLKILAVTVLTSLDAYDIHDMGYECSVKELVLHRAKKCLEAGCDGVIASGQEAKDIKEIAANNLLIITPGIRPEGIGRDDHKRSTSPKEAIIAGADYLVVGRPITKDKNPRLIAENIIAEMQSALD